MSKEQQYNDELTNFIQGKELEVANERMRRMRMENEIGEISDYKSRDEVNLVKYQLEMTDELETIFHIFQGQYLGVDEKGNQVWRNPDDDRLIIFSDYGVKRLMNILSMYITKNKLLAYYDDKMIKWKMQDFGITLTDLLNNSYELFFYFPSPEDLYEKYLPLIKENKINLTEQEFYEKCLIWSEEELQKKIVNIPMIIQSILDFVHDTYQRALNGKERQSYREKYHISQNTPMGFQPNQKDVKQSIFNPKTW